VGSQIATFGKYITYGFAKPEKQVPMASRLVLVSRLRVLRSRLPVPVASRQVPIGSEVRAETRFEAVWNCLDKTPKGSNND
jgi:hypothetical protein